MISVSHEGTWWSSYFGPRAKYGWQKLNWNLYETELSEKCKHCPRTMTWLIVKISWCCFLSFWDDERASFSCWLSSVESRRVSAIFFCEITHSYNFANVWLWRPAQTGSQCGPSFLDQCIKIGTDFLGDPQNIFPSSEESIQHVCRWV